MGAAASRVEQEDLIGNKFPDPQQRKAFRKYSSDDLKQYQKGYPGVKDHPDLWDNYRFFTNQLGMRPGGYLIEDIFKRAERDPTFIEDNPGLIQWLFPIREPGMNLQAQPLQMHEAQAISNHPVAKSRVFAGYEMMLNHLGMILVDTATGEVERGPGFLERCNIFKRKENIFKISRMMKSLGEFNLEAYKEPWVRFLMKEILVENSYGPLFVPAGGGSGKTAPSPMLIALHDFWIPFLRDQRARLTMWLEFKGFYLKKIQTQSLSPQTRQRRQSEANPGFFHRLGSLRSSLRGSAARRSLRSSMSTPSTRIEDELLDAERALTSHLVEQETKRMMERNLASGMKSIAQIDEEDCPDSSNHRMIIASAPPLEPPTDAGTDKSESFLLQPDVVRSASLASEDYVSV